MDIKKLLPLNGYGYSKQLFDLWVEKQSLAPRQHVGFKFFNVYGPNEYYKGSMASVIFHSFNKILETGQMGIFKSYKEGYEDGKQLRDFVYVKDLCKVVHFMIEHPKVSGLFNQEVFMIWQQQLLMQWVLKGILHSLKCQSLSDRNISILQKQKWTSFVKQDIKMIFIH